MSTGIGLPKLDVVFSDAAKQAATRTKAGIVAVMIRDATESKVSLTAMGREKDIPADMPAENANYVKRAMLGTSMGKPRTVYVVKTPVDAEGSHTHLNEGLDVLRAVSVDYLAIYPDAKTEEYTVAVAWVKTRRAELNVVKLVASNTAADNEGIINFCSTVKITSGDITPAAYCSRIAGLLAGLPSTCSGTFAVLEDVIAVATSEDPSADIDAGKLIVIHDGVKAKIARGVNSLTTTTTEKGDMWKKIKLVEASDLIGYYCRTTIEDYYIGKYPNTYDNKQLLISAIKTYLNYMEADGMLLPGSSSVDIDLDQQIDFLRGQGDDTLKLTDQQVREYYTSTWVFLIIRGTRMDTMEDFNLRVFV